MATTPVTNAANTAATAQQAGENALAKLSGDYTMFLKLLTSQMTNQDPLNPMDTSQYTQQLVQYSQVEQSIQQSQTLKDILARLSSQDMIQASGLIGHSVDYQGAQAGLSDAAPAQWRWTLPRPATSLVATITDASGKVVNTRTLDPASKTLSWDGKLGTGAQAPAGSYTLALEAKDSLGNSVKPTLYGIGAVDAVSMADNILMLSINGAQIAASTLAHVR